jgi:hypothetical protein
VDCDRHSETTLIGWQEWREKRQYLMLEVTRPTDDQQAKRRRADKALLGTGSNQASSGKSLE